MNGVFGNKIVIVGVRGGCGGAGIDHRGKIIAERVERVKRILAIPSFCVRASVRACVPTNLHAHVFLFK